jgi:signal peptidase II
MSTPDHGDPGPQLAQHERVSLSALYVRLLGAASLVAGLDQLTKEWALNALDRGREIDVIAGVLRLRLTLNSGGAFGIFQGTPGVFLVATLAIVAAILIGVRRVEDRSWAIPLGMVLGGGIGNALDRIVRDTGGGVIDFIDLHVWPVFNFADSAIVIGAGLILILSLRSAEPE